MRKKTYVEPTAEVVKLHIERALLLTVSGEGTLENYSDPDDETWT